MRVLITGARGLMGLALAEESRRRGHETAAPGRQELNVTDPEACREAVQAAAPDLVLHCAGFTDVDGAEAAREEAFRVNRDGAEHVARAVAEGGRGLFIYPGTDYVFDGSLRRPYRPDDPPRPLNVYGRSKLEGERAVREVFKELDPRAGSSPGPARGSAPQAPSGSGAAFLILRTSWLYGKGGSNLVDAVIEKARKAVGSRTEGRSREGSGEPKGGEPLRVVDDQWGSPTWTGSLAPTVLDLAEAMIRSRSGPPARETGGTGTAAGDRDGSAAADPDGPEAAARSHSPLPPSRILHLSNRGGASWYELAVEALRIAGIDAAVDPVSSDEWDSPARRPPYSVLDPSAAEAILGRGMPHWRESLERYLEGTERSGTSGDPSAPSPPRPLIP